MTNLKETSKILAHYFLDKPLKIRLNFKKHCANNNQSIAQNGKQ